MPTPELWLVAGPNGAGKTTLVQAAPIALLLPDVRFLNADDRTLESLQERGFEAFADAPPDVLRECFIASAERVNDELHEAVRLGERIGVETVLSTDKYRGLVEGVCEAGGVFRMIYVALESPELSAERIANRVRHGGHDIPADRIEARWRRSLEQLPWFLERARTAWIYDNSNCDPHEPPVLIAESREGNVSIHNECFGELERALKSL